MYTVIKYVEQMLTNFDRILRFLKRNYDEHIVLTSYI